MPPRRPRILNTVLAAFLCVFTVSEVNYPLLRPESQLAIFATVGLVLCFLNRPIDRRLESNRAAWVSTSPSVRSSIR